MKLFGFISLLLIALSCSEEPPVAPPPPPPTPSVNDTINVGILDITHRSIVLNVQTTSNNPNSLIEVYRRFDNVDITTAEYSINVVDTTIVDDNNGQGLQLDTEYSYYAVRKDTTGERKDTSDITTARTFAASDFNYTWQEYSIGEWNSVLNDVWGTDENNVYAVGGVRLNDTVYGIIKWNGAEWLPEKKFGGLQAIYGFSESDIWAVGGGVWHFNGFEWEEYTFTDPVITENIAYSSIWGTSSSNLYWGNGGGKIIYWNGSNAELVYTNPDIVQVRELDGYSSDFILGVGTGMVPPLLAVYYNGNSWSNLPISSDWSLNSVTIVTTNQIYFGGDGIFNMRGTEFTRIETFGFYIRDIEYNRQTGVIVATSAFDGVYLYNGIEWRDYRGQITFDDTAYNGIFLTGNTIICVGGTINEAKIIIGKN